MSNPYSRARMGAIAAGLLCTAGAGAVLLEDVAAHGVTIDHALSVVVLLGTIAAGHLALGEARAWRVGRALALVVLAALGSTYCVLSTAGRTAEHAAAQRAAVTADNRRIVEAGEQLRTARERLDAAAAEAIRECRSGFKAKCEGWRRTEAERQARVDQLVAEIGRLGAVKVGDQRARNVAEIVASVTGLDAARVERAAGLLLPFVPALFLELGAVVFLFVGAGDSAARTPSGASDCPAGSRPDARALGERGPGKTETLADDFQQRLPQPRAGGRLPEGESPAPAIEKTLPANVVPFSRSIAGNDVHPVLAALAAAGGTVASNRELAQRMGVSEGESTKRVREVADRLTVERVGREVRIGLR